MKNFRFFTRPFVVVIITKGMRVKCTPESDSGVLLYEGGDSCCLSTI